MTNTNETLEVISVRMPPAVLRRLPAPSLTGERAQFIREAIEEKLDREARAVKRRMAAASKKPDSKGKDPWGSV